VQIGSLIERLESWAPLRLAESWDSSGLQVGNPERKANAVFLCLDVSEVVLDEAISHGAHLILSHHPMLFTPPKSLDIRSKTGKLVHKCLVNDLTVYSMHTNLDKVTGGMNDYVAKCLEMNDISALVPSSTEGLYYKLVTFVPPDYREPLLEALFQAGGGRIEAYEGCSFSSPGEGTFFAGEDTSPFVGEKGKLSRVGEMRVEVLFPSDALQKGIKALKSSHPYEVPAFDIYPLTLPKSLQGFGRVGTYEPPLPWASLLARIREVFSLSDLRVVGNAVDPVSHMAICTGSGASFISQAAGVAEVYITGDVRFHEAQEAESLGLTVIDAGHFALERIFVDLMDAWFEKEGLKSLLKVFKSTVERDPFTFIHGGENH